MHRSCTRADSADTGVARIAHSHELSQLAIGQGNGRSNATRHHTLHPIWDLAQAMQATHARWGIPHEVVGASSKHAPFEEATVSQISLIMRYFGVPIYAVVPGTW